MFSGSPLCPASSPIIKRRLSSAGIVEAWSEAGHDVSGYFRGIDEVLLLECPTSRLQFFGPSRVIGEASLYAFLGTRPWYYDSEKWELGEVVKSLGEGDLRTALEVGCGSGQFLALAQKAGLSAVGIDINAEAIREAQARGLSASTDTFSNIQRSGERFDAVVAFQVLEHVVDPLQLLTGMASVVRPGGSIYIAVPNADTWISRRLALLDTPPHHYTRWTLAAFQYITRVLPIDLADVRCEPMAAKSLPAWAISICDPDPPGIADVVNVSRRASFKRRAVARATASLFAFSGMPAPADGPSLLVRFRRREC